MTKADMIRTTDPAYTPFRSPWCVSGAYSFPNSFRAYAGSITASLILAQAAIERGAKNVRIEFEGL